MGIRGPKPIPVLAEPGQAAPLEVEQSIGEHGIVTTRIGIPADEISGLLRDFVGPARAVLTGLLRGYSLGMAAASAGVSVDTVQRWRKAYPEFAAAENRASQWGFASVYEAELYDRALDRADRGSMRALELVAKARDAAYRDRLQGQIDVVHRAIAAEQAITAGWQAPDDIKATGSTT